MPSGREKNTWVLWVGGLGVAIVVAIVVILDPIGTPVNGLIRAAAVLGYVGVFMAGLSSNYMRELTRFFGRPFFKVHHVASVTALVALAMHSTSVVVRSQSPRLFVPSAQTPQALALWLLALASLVALFRKNKKLRKIWKVVHWANYLAFLIGTLHAQNLGANFQHVVIRIASILMAVTLVAVFVWKRIRDRRAKRKR